MAQEKIYFDGHLVNFSSSNGYPTIWNGKQNVLVHRLQWEKHFGEIPKGFVIHHKDENKLNWNIENLELLPMNKHGKHHALKNKLGKSNKGKIKRHNSGFCKGATPIKLIKNNECLYFESVTKASEFLNVKQIGDVSRVLTGKRKTIKGWRCEYAVTRETV